MTESVYHLRNVHRQLSNTFRLLIDDLRIRNHEVLAVVGPTGAGKTTLLRILTGLEYPDEGTVHFKDSRLFTHTPQTQLRSIAMVHQRPFLMNSSVQSNIEYGLRVRGILQDSKVQSILNQLQLGGLARRNARSLSGGQTQLVALARALVVEPEVLLLDEPTANLDPAYVSLVERVIGDFKAARNITIVWATHNLFQARRVSHRTALMLNGDLVEIAESQAFFESSRDPRTAAFVQGRMVY